MEDAFKVHISNTIPGIDVEIPKSDLPLMEASLELCSELREAQFQSNVQLTQNIRTILSKYNDTYSKGKYVPQVSIAHL